MRSWARNPTTEYASSSLRSASAAPRRPRRRCGAHAGSGAARPVMGSWTRNSTTDHANVLMPLCAWPDGAHAGTRGASYRRLPITFRASYGCQGSGVLIQPDSPAVRSWPGTQNSTTNYAAGSCRSELGPPALGPGLSSKFTEFRHSHSCCLLTCLIFQPFSTCPCLTPAPPCHPATNLAGRSLLQAGLFGPALRACSQRSTHLGLPLRGTGHGGLAFCSPHLCSVTSPSPCPRHGPTLTVPSQVPPRITSPSYAWPWSRSIGHCPLLTPGGHVPRWSPAPVTAQLSRTPIAHGWWSRSHFLLTPPPVTSPFP